MPRAPQRAAPPLPTVTSPLGRAATERLSREMEAEKLLRPMREPLSAPPVDLDGLRVVGMDSGPVPEFELTRSDGSVVRSKEWVGKRPFAVLFFASWCQVCEMKIPLVRAALEKVPEMSLLLVSVDEPETWRNVPGYLREQHLAQQPVVSGLENPRFTLGYDPMGAVPLVVVVGRDGRLVDYQVGLTGDDAARLADAMQKAVAPLGAGAALPGVVPVGTVPSGVR